MKCSTCNKDCDSLLSIIHRGKVLSGCEQCIASQRVTTDGHSAKFYRDAQKKEFRRELTQPWEKDYARAYPDQAREEWGDDTARRHV